MNINVTKRKDWIIVYIAGRLDASNAGELETQLNKIFEKTPEKTLVSLKELEYISSAGLRVLLSFAKKLPSYKTQLYFAELGDNVKSVFEISGFYSLFTIYETIEDAFA